MPSNLTPSAELAAKREPRFDNESADYAAKRVALLAEEIEVRRHLTRLAEQRRELPEGPAIEDDFRFIDETGFEVSLADLFGKHDTLLVYHWMVGPERERPCPMCTNFLGPIDANGADIEQRLALAVVGRSKVERQRAFAQERGWQHLRFFQTKGEEFQRRFLGEDNKGLWDYAMYAVLVREGEGDDAVVRLHWMEEMNEGMADPGQDPRGAIDMPPLWNILDLTPEGRPPTWYPKLSYPPN
jgi:predicted dithiol-disulfide oxidoreductase (DUF899 family)